MLVGTKSPMFSASAVMPSGTVNHGFSLYDYKDKKYCLLYFYPGAFTFVCPTDILAFEKKVAEFKAIETAIACVSVDSIDVLSEWTSRTIKDGGIGKVDIALISDIKKTICSSYGLIDQSGLSMRAVVLVDKDGVIRYYSVHDQSVGFNADELIRVTKAIQFVDKTGKLCPSGWVEGNKGIDRTRNSTIDHLSS